MDQDGFPYLTDPLVNYANNLHSLVPLVSQVPDILESKEGRASKKSGEGKDYTDFDSSFFSSMILSSKNYHHRGHTKIHNN